MCAGELRYRRTALFGRGREHCFWVLISGTTNFILHCTLADRAKVPPPNELSKSSPDWVISTGGTVAAAANACCAVHSAANTVLHLLPLRDYGGGSVEAEGKGWNSDWAVSAELVSIARR